MTMKSEGNNKRPTADEQRREMAVLAAAIHELDPWNNASSTEPFVSVNEDCSQMFICRFVIDSDGDRGFLMLPAPRDYARCAKCDDAREKMRNYIEMRYYGVFFSEWEKLPEREQKAYERLSIRFSDGCWPRFIHKRYGCMEAPVTSNEFETMEECLWHLREQLEAMYDNGDLFNFKPGDIALRHYDTEAREWKNILTPVEMWEDPGRPLMIYASVPILQSLKQVPVSKKVLELEVDYGWIVPGELPASGYEFEMQVVVADRRTREVLTGYRCFQKDFTECMLTSVSDAIFKYGKPKAIYIARDESADLLGDLACKLGIQLKRAKSLPGATNYLYSCRAV